MSDLVRRLREGGGQYGDPYYDEAADDIERLQADLQNARNKLKASGRTKLRAERNEWETACNIARDERDGLRAERDEERRWRNALAARLEQVTAEVEALRSLLRQTRDSVAVMDQRLAEISTNKELLYAGLVSRIDAALLGKVAT